MLNILICPHLLLRPSIRSTSTTDMAAPPRCDYLPPSSPRRSLASTFCFASPPSITVDITNMTGATWDDKWQASSTLVRQTAGSGVIYFPPGNYTFSTSLLVPRLRHDPRGWAISSPSSTSSTIAMRTLSSDPTASLPSVWRT